MPHDAMKLTSSNLQTIMKSASFGTVKADSEGTITKSSTFAGISWIKSRFDPEMQKANNLAKATFVEDLSREFHLNAHQVEEFKEKMGMGDGKPLSIRDAKQLISHYHAHRNLSDYIDTQPLNPHTFMNRELKVTLSDPKFFDKSIEKTLRNELSEDLKSILENDGKEQDLIEFTQNWAKEQGRDNDVGAARHLLKELGFLR